MREKNKINVALTQDFFKIFFFALPQKKVFYREGYFGTFDDFPPLERGKGGKFSPLQKKGGEKISPHQNTKKNTLKCPKASAACAAKRDLLRTVRPSATTSWHVSTHPVGAEVTPDSAPVVETQGYVQLYQRDVRSDSRWGLRIWCANRVGSNRSRRWSQGSRSDRPGGRSGRPGPVFVSLKMKTVDLYRLVHSGVYSVVWRFRIRSRVGAKGLVSGLWKKGFRFSNGFVTALWATSIATNDDCNFHALVAAGYFWDDLGYFSATFHK